MEKYDRKAEFIKVLAEYLVKDQCKKSIELQMGKESAKEWAHMRAHVPLHGYLTVEEAVITLTEFLR